MTDDIFDNNWTDIVSPRYYITSKSHKKHIFYNKSFYSSLQKDNVEKKTNNKKNNIIEKQPPSIFIKTKVQNYQTRYE